MSDLKLQERLKNQFPWFAMEPDFWYRLFLHSQSTVFPSRYIFRTVPLLRCCAAFGIFREEWATWDFRGVWRTNFHDSLWSRIFDYSSQKIIISPRSWANCSEFLLEKGKFQFHWHTGVDTNQQWFNGYLIGLQTSGLVGNASKLGSYHVPWAKQRVYKAVSMILELALTKIWLRSEG